MPNKKLDDLVQAIRAGDKTTVERLITENSELRRANVPGAATPLLLALYCGQAEVAKMFEAQDATLDLFESCALGVLDRVRRCVDRAPASANSIAADGYFPLGLAAFFGHFEIVQYLLTHGADVNLAAKNSTRVTALHGAVTRGATEVVKLLLKHGANPNSLQEGGFTPLHSAAAAGHEAIVRLLVEHGAELSPRSDQEKTPYDYAIERGKSDVAEWLKLRALNGK